MYCTMLIAFVLSAATDAGTSTRKVEERFLAPCCWRENLAVHRSPEAEEMRRELRKLVISGRTEDEIVRFYVARYGPRILREPEGDAALWLKAVPVAAGAIGLLLVAGYIKRAQRRTPAVLGFSAAAQHRRER